MRIPSAAAPALVVAIAAAAFGGCGGGGDGARTGAPTNGLEKLPASKVQARMVAALASADSVHMRVNATTGDSPGTFDLRFSGDASTGVVAVKGGARFAITRIGDTAYVKADRASLEALGASARLARAGAGRWIRFPDGQLTLDGYSLPELIAQLAQDKSPRDPEIAPATLDGKPVVVVSRPDGTKLYIANTGPAYPLRGEYTGDESGRVEFSEYGADFHIAAPRGAIDAAALVKRPAA